MTADELLTRLECVRSRGHGRWSARCPSHTDKSPSLSIHEGERGTLLKCFAGCSIEEICGALGIRQADLFYDRGLDSRQIQQRQRERSQQALEQCKQGRRIDACREAEYFIQSRTGLDISQWSDDQLDYELNLIADASRILEGDPYGTN